MTLLKTLKTIASRAERIEDAINDFMPRIFATRDRYKQAHDQLYRLRLAIKEHVQDERALRAIMHEWDEAEASMCRLADAVSAAVKMELAARDYSLLMLQVRSELDEMNKGYSEGEKPTLVTVYTQEEQVA